MTKRRIDEALQFLFLIASLILIAYILVSCVSRYPSRNINDMTPEEICKAYGPGCEVIQ